MILCNIPSQSFVYFGCFIMLISFVQYQVLSDLYVRLKCTFVLSFNRLYHSKLDLYIITVFALYKDMLVLLIFNLLCCCYSTLITRVN